MIISEDELRRQMELKQIQEQIKTISSTLMEKKARERLANVRLVKPELALQVEAYLVQLYQSGRLKKKITEQQLIQILKTLQSKKDFKIRRI